MPPAPAEAGRGRVKTRWLARMDRWFHVVLFVVAGFLLGLAHPMVLLGPQVLVEV